MHFFFKQVLRRKK